MNMDQVFNPSVNALAKMVCEQQEENGFALLLTFLPSHSN